MTTKRQVEWEGKSYRVKSDTVEIPDLTSLDRIAALVWLNQNTYRRGYSTAKPNPLAGYGGTVSAR